MGFTPPRTVYTLVFDGTDFDGLVIRVRAASMGDRLHAFYDLGWTKDDDADTRRSKQRQQFELMIEHVVEWNLETADGEPVPVTVDGLLGVCEPEQVGAILGAWQSGRQSVPAPLDQRSPGISLSEIPMTVQRSTPAHAA